MTQTASTNKLQLRLEIAASTSNASKSYYLVIRKDNDLAIDCSCPHRVHRGRKCGKACKHMMVHNNKMNQQRREAKLVAQVVAKPMPVYDVVGAALVVVNQAMADQKIGDTYEQMKKCCPRCGEQDLLYPRTGRCQWVPTYEAL